MVRGLQDVEYNTYDMSLDDLYISHLVAQKIVMLSGGLPKFTGPPYTKQDINTR